MQENINLNLYKIFYYVASLKSFNEAAQKLYISQPAVSKQIKNLEDILDIKLFIRLNKGIELTREGKVLFEQVEKMFFYLDNSNKNLLLAKNMLVGEIVIGCPSHITSFYLLKYIKEFKKKYPHIIIRVDSSSTTELINKLEHNKIDFIIDCLPIDIDINKYVVKPLKKISTTFIISKEYKKNVTNMDDISSKYFILPPKKSSMRRSLDEILQKNKVSLNVGMLVETTDLIIGAVKNNIGIGYVIKDAVIKELKNKEVFEINVNFDLPVLELNLVYPVDYLSYPAKKFLEKYINVD